MNKKYFKTFGLAAVCAITPAIISSGTTFAAENDYISLYQHESGQSDQICYLYRNSYSEYTPQCDLSYGSFDVATNTLTLKSAINNLPNTSIHFSGNTPVTVTSNGNIETAFSAAAKQITLDFGSHTYKEKPYEFGQHMNNNSFGSLIIKSGTFDLQYIGASTLQILGGNITFAPDQIAAISTDTFLMNGGTIVSPSSSMFISSRGDIVINGGEILAENIKTSGLSTGNGGAFIMGGGKVNLKSAEQPAGFGILNHNENINTTIAGGELTIDGFDWGISGEKNKIIFNGGTTTIKNSKEHTIWLTFAKDPEHDIVFGDNMGIKEDTYVFWDDDEWNPSTGIAEPGNVTIAEGYTYRRHYGWEDIDSPNSNNSNNSNVPSVPDTGFFGVDGKTATIVSLIGALPIIATLGYALRFIIKRNKQRVKF